MENKQELNKEQIIKLINQLQNAVQFNQEFTITLDDYTSVLNTWKKILFKKWRIWVLYSMRIKLKTKIFNEQYILKLYLISIILFLSKHKSLIMQKDLDFLTDLVIKCYKDNLIKIEYMISLIKFVLYLSVLSFSSNNKDKIITKHIHNIFYIQYSIDMINKMFEDKNEITFEEEKKIESYIEFFHNKILSKNTNILLIINQSPDDLNIYDLLSIIPKCPSELKQNLQAKLIGSIKETGLLDKIYQFNFNYQNSMIPLLKQMKNLYLNIRDKTIPTLKKEIAIADIQMKYINNLYEKEFHVKKNDPFLLERCFYNRKTHLEIKISSIKLEESYTLIGSFKLIVPKYKPTPEIYLFLFFIHKETLIFAISIEKSEGNKGQGYYLHIFQPHNKIKTNILIKENKTYLMKFEINPPNEEKTKGKTLILITYMDNRNIQIERCEINKIKTGKIDVCLGGSNLLPGLSFRGYIGPLLIFNSLKDNSFFKLQGYYEYYFWRFLLPQNSHFQIDIPNFLKMEEELKKYIKGKKEEFIGTVFSPKIYNDNNNINKSQKIFVIKDTKIVKLDVSINTDFDNKFYVCQNRLTLDFFVNNDGLKFLCLHLEYYYQIIVDILKRNDNEQKETDKDDYEVLEGISNNLIAVLGLIFTIIDNTEIKKIEIDLRKVFYILSAVFKELIKTNISNENNFLILQNIETYIYDKKRKSSTENEFYSSFMDCFFEFFLNKKLYKGNQYKIISEVITNLKQQILYGEKEKLLLGETLRKFLDFHEIFLLEQKEELLYLNYNELLYLFFNNYICLIKDKKNKKGQGCVLQRVEDEEHIFEIYINFILEHKDNPILLEKSLNILHKTEFINYLDDISVLEYEFEKRFPKDRVIKDNTQDRLIYILFVQIFIEYYSNDLNQLNLFFNKYLNPIAFDMKIAFSYCLEDKEKAKNLTIDDDLNFDERNKFKSERILNIFSAIWSFILNNQIKTNQSDIDEIVNLFEKGFTKIQAKKDNNYFTIFSQEKIRDSSLIYYLDIKYNEKNFPSKEELSQKLYEQIEKFLINLLPNHPNSFIFWFLYYHANKGILNYSYYQKIIEKINEILLNTEGIKSNIRKSNFINYLIFLGNLIKVESLKGLITFDLLDIICTLLKNDDLFELRTLYSHNYLSNFPENKKLVNEMLFDILIQLYEYSPSNLFYKIFEKFYIEIKAKINLLIILKDGDDKKLSSEYKKSLENMKLIFCRMDNEQNPKDNLNKKNPPEDSQYNLSLLILYIIKTQIMLNKSNISGELRKFLIYFNHLLLENAYYLSKEKKNNYLIKQSQNKIYHSFQKHIDNDYIKQKKKRSVEFINKILSDKIKKYILENNYNNDYSFYSSGYWIKSISDIKGDIDKKYETEILIEKSSNRESIQKERLHSINSSNETEIKKQEILDNKEENANKKTQKKLNSFENFDFKSHILNIKTALLLGTFGLEFKDAFFENDLFENMKKYYCSHYKTNIQTKQLKYPSRIRNFSNGYEANFFLKPDMHFFKSIYFPISHSYFEDIIKNKTPKELYLYRKPIQIKHELKSFYAELIKIDMVIFGKIYILNDYIAFINSKDDPRKNEKEINFDFVFSSIDIDVVEKDKCIIFFYPEIEEIVQRKFLYQDQALEIYMKDGKSFLLNFFSWEKKDNFIQSLKNFKFLELNNDNISITPNKNEKKTVKDIKPNPLAFFPSFQLDKEMKISHGIFCDDPKKFFKNNYYKLWKEYKLSNYKYLLYVNKYASRTFNDSNQYPIFPWVLRSYENLNEPEMKANPFLVNDQKERKKKKIQLNLRIMEYPLSCQNEDKREETIEKYMDNNGLAKKYPYHLGSHYSTSSFIYYYLMRLIPFTNSLIKLQNYNQENPNRMFISFKNTQNSLENSHDNRELLPEHYSSIENLINLNSCYFGKDSNVNIIDDIKMEKPFLKDYTTLVQMHRILLDSEPITNELPKWINWIFGITQKSKDANSCITFPKHTYSYKMHLEKKFEKYKEKIKEGLSEYICKLKDKKDLVINFGQCPPILFDTKHAKATIKTPLNIEQDDYERFSANMHAKNFRTKIDNSHFFWISSSKNFIFVLKKLQKDKKEEVCYIESFYTHFNDKLASNPHFEEYAQIYINSYGKFESLSHKDDIDKIFEFENIFIDMLDCRCFIICQYYDHSFKIYYNYNEKGNKFLKPSDSIPYSVICDDYVNCIAKYDEMTFYTGHKNGKLCEWEFQENQERKIKLKKSIYQHNKAITLIRINKRLRIIITAGEDNYVYIRKVYNFELLSYFKIDKKFKIKIIKVSTINFIYILVFDKNKNKHCILGYTLTGLNFAQSEYGDYYNIEMTESGNVILGIKGADILKVLKGGDLESFQIETEKNIIKNERSIIEIRVNNDPLYESLTEIEDFHFPCLWFKYLRKKHLFVTYFKLQKGLFIITIELKKKKEENVKKKGQLAQKNSLLNFDLTEEYLAMKRKQKEEEREGHDYKYFY